MMLGMLGAGEGKGKGSVNGNGNGNKEDNCAEIESHSIEKSGKCRELHLALCAFTLRYLALR